MVGRPVAKGSAVPDGRPSARRVHRPAGRFRIPLSVFDFHERYPLSAETGGGVLDCGRESVRPRESEIQPTPDPGRGPGSAAAPEAIAAETSTESRLRSRFACSIVGRGQLQRKQRLDAVGRRSAPGAGRVRGRSADWLETLAPLLAPESLRDDVEGRPLLGGDAASESQTLRDAARSLGDLATGVHDARDALLTLLR